jgi:hypothetical protein
MEDLIKEDEFVKKEYNPWPYFKAFYLTIPLFALIRFIVASSVANDLSVFITALNTILPIIISCLMIFSRKRNILLPTPTIFKAIFYLMCIVCLTLQIFNIIEVAYFRLDPSLFGERIVYALVSPFIHFVICIIIVLPVRALIKRIIS